MHTFTTAGELQQHAFLAKDAGRKIALVITNGALHEGHRSILAAARRYADTLIVSVFANPLQFGPSEGFASYPRTPDADLKLCAEAKADVVFMPALEEMFPKGYSTHVQEESVSKGLCGPSRPSHFRGVTTITAKLLNLVRPDFLVMGQKDIQQVAVIRKMIADLHFKVEVVVISTVRAPDGLAIGVRGRDLTPTQRTDAQSIQRAFDAARRMVAQGTRSPDRIIAEATHILGQHRRIRIIYISIVNRISLEPMREVIPGESLLAIAAWVDEVRLIDNTEL